MTFVLLSFNKRGDVEYKIPAVLQSEAYKYHFQFMPCWFMLLLFNSDKPSNVGLTTVSVETSKAECCEKSVVFDYSSGAKLYFGSLPSQLSCSVVVFCLRVPIFQAPKAHLVEITYFSLLIEIIISIVMLQDSYSDSNSKLGCCWDGHTIVCE